MKTVTFILATASILLLTSCSKDTSSVKISSIPEAVKKSFQTEYPKTKDAKWGIEGEYFKAEFEEEGLEKAVVYDKDGSIIATETEIDVVSLPANVTEYISNNYNSYTINEAEKEVSTEGTFFEVELENGNQEVVLVFDNQGHFIEHNSEEDSDEDDAEGEDDENEKEIGTNELPQVIKDAIAKQYPGAKLMEADEVTQSDGNVTFDVEIIVNGKTTELMYDAQGNFLGVETDDDDENENDNEIDD